jgi:peptidoglycan/LPS O-acetylase OafA/YrhL
MSEPVTQPSRLKSLDVLRAVAVLLVFGRHFNLFRPLHKGGWSGVDLFFVLSGFLISGLLFTDFRKFGRIRIGRFLVRRGFKIYPPFYAFLGCTILMYAVEHGHPPVRPFLAEVFFLQSYLKAIWAVTWSLAAEEHFYLVLPVLLILLCRFSRHQENPFRMLPWLFLSVAAGSLAFRLVLCADGPRPLETVYYPTHMCVDALLFGVLLSYFHQFQPAVFDRLKALPGWFLLPASLSLIAPCFFLDLESSWFIQTLGHPMLYLGYGGLLLFALSGVALPAGFSSLARLGDALGFVGKHSYSIYLWHAAVAFWGIEYLKRHGYVGAFGPPQYLLCILVSLALGIGMSRLVEFPSLRLRDRLFPSLAGPLTVRRPEAPAPLPLTSPVTEAG